MEYAAIAIISALIGAWAGSRLNFGFQQKLLKQQLNFEEQSQKQLHTFIKSLHDTFLGTIKELDHHLSRIADRLPGGKSYADFYQAVEEQPKKPESESKIK